MIELRFFEINHHGEAISWSGKFESIVDEMLELFQDRVESSDETIARFKENILAANDPKINAMVLCDVMAASCRDFDGVGYTYAWQVIE